MELKTARQIAQLSQRQLAEKAGVDPSAISLLERGEREYATVGYEAIVRIARALNVEPDVLFPIPPATADSATEAKG